MDVVEEANKIGKIRLLLYAGVLVLCIAYIGWLGTNFTSIKETTESQQGLYAISLIKSGKVLCFNASNFSYTSSGLQPIVNFTNEVIPK